MKPPPNRVATVTARDDETLPIHWPWAFCATLALWLSLSRLQHNHNADSLLPSMMSTLAWTPYFWRQGRYGQLWALVCAGIHHPLLNMIALMFCNIVFGLAAHFLLARFLWRKNGPWQWTGLLSIAVTMVLGSDRFIFETLSPLQFMTSPLAFGLCAIFWLEQQAHRPQAVVGAIAAFGLVAWYNPAAPVLLASLLAWALLAQLWQLTAAAKPAPKLPILVALARRELLAVAGVLTCAAVAMYTMRHAFYHSPVFDHGLPLDLWRDTAWRLTKSFFTAEGDDQGSPKLAGAAGVCFLALSAVAWARNKAGARIVWARAAAGILAAACYGAAISQRAWARQEGCNARYFFPVLFVIVSSVCLLAVGLFRSRAPKDVSASASRLNGRDVVTWEEAPQAVSKRPAAALVFATFVVVALRFGAPSYTGVETFMTAWTGKVGQQLMDVRATHVAGRYWDAWPAAFYVNWKRYELGDRRPFLAISNYAEATLHLWPKDRRNWRIGLLKKDPSDVQHYLLRYQVPELQIIDETSELWLAQPKAASANK